MESRRCGDCRRLPSCGYGRPEHLACERFEPGAASAEGPLPCPFCGGRDLSVRPIWQTWRFVACACKAAGAPGRTEAEAIANWNRRSAPKERDLEQGVLF